MLFYIQKKINPKYPLNTNKILFYYNSRNNQIKLRIYRKIYLQKIKLHNYYRNKFYNKKISKIKLLKYMCIIIYNSNLKKKIKSKMKLTK